MFHTSCAILWKPVRFRIPKASFRMTLSETGLFRLACAEGWLDLGNFLEANNELERDRIIESCSSSRSRNALPEFTKQQANGR
jgi:hypothetical protein